MGLSSLTGFDGLFPFSCWGSFLLQKFSQTLSFFLLPLRPLYSNIGAFNIVPGVSKAILNSFHSFPFILLFQLTYMYFCLIILLLVPFRVFLISVIMLLISAYSLFFLCHHQLYKLALTVVDTSISIAMSKWPSQHILRVVSPLLVPEISCSGPSRQNRSDQTMERGRG